MRLKILAVAGVAALAAACGTTPGQRAVTGGLLGAGAGAAIANNTNGHPGTGALIGAGVGAVAGAATAPRASNGAPVDRRQYYDQRSGRYYWYDPQSNRYYYENGSPYP
ncbi:MAG: YMGG-like glycine zipper-containing protein [Hyphomonadaceae bacterium]